MEVQILPTIRAMFQEVVAVGRAMGYDESTLSTAAVESAIEGTATLNKRADSRHKPSMLLDLEREQPLELDVILGEVIHRAKELKVDIPVWFFLSSLSFSEGPLTLNCLLFCNISADRDIACAADCDPGSDYREGTRRSGRGWRGSVVGAVHFVCFVFRVNGTHGHCFRSFFVP